MRGDRGGRWGRQGVGVGTIHPGHMFTHDGRVLPPAVPVTEALIDGAGYALIPGVFRRRALEARPQRNQQQVHWEAG